ncbi:hypothetical protein DdX_01430 [Ditylenchus destructor]|uniref:Uncharacterized protein n=1 Tax=Ditylenchus destructor TaxID=166010 RepID=A0AAD4NML3_9BILA|nr:hypothetical protein DdX_01430 [Ditylenchus destructor]
MGVIFGTWGFSDAPSPNLTSDSRFILTASCYLNRSLTRRNMEFMPPKPSNRKRQGLSNQTKSSTCKAGGYCHSDSARISTPGLSTIYDILKSSEKCSSGCQARRWR